MVFERPTVDCQKSPTGLFRPNDESLLDDQLWIVCEGEDDELRQQTLQRNRECCTRVPIRGRDLVWTPTSKMFGSFKKVCRKVISFHLPSQNPESFATACLVWWTFFLLLTASYFRSFDARVESPGTSFRLSVHKPSSQIDSTCHVTQIMNKFQLSWKRSSTLRQYKGNEKTNAMKTNWMRISDHLESQWTQSNARIVTWIVIDSL